MAKNPSLKPITELPLTKKLVDVLDARMAYHEHAI
jgi:hypothetical protein